MPKVAVKRFLCYPEVTIAFVDCPYCSEEHSHGCGNPCDKLFLGTRSSHCYKGEYELTLFDSR